VVGNFEPCFAGVGFLWSDWEGECLGIRVCIVQAKLVETLISLVVCSMADCNGECEGKGSGYNLVV
jgi:hypothetical protein